MHLEKIKKKIENVSLWKWNDAASLTSKWNRIVTTVRAPQWFEDPTKVLTLMRAQVILERKAAVGQKLEIQSLSMGSVGSLQLLRD